MVVDDIKLLKNFLEIVPCGAYIRFGGSQEEYINEVLSKWIGHDKTNELLKHKSSFNELFKRGKDFTTKLESVTLGDTDKIFMMKKSTGYGIYRITCKIFDSFGIEAFVYFFEDITELHFAEINISSSQSYIDRLTKSLNTKPQSEKGVQATQDVATSIQSKSADATQMDVVDEPRKSVATTAKDRVEEAAKSALNADVIAKEEGGGSEKDSSKKANVNSFMSPEDVNDLEEILESVFAILPHIYEDMDEHIVVELGGLLMRFGTILAVYNETYNIAFSIQLVSREIRKNVPDFIKQASKVKSSMYYFYADLETWVHKLFREGASSVNFMNDSIVCNCYQIVDMFKKDSAIEDDEMFF